MKKIRAAVFRRLLLTALLLLGLCSFACAGRKTNDQELIVGVGSDDYIIEPLKSRLGMFPLTVNACETLVSLSPDYRIEPSLASRWEQHENTWRFFLRSGVVFSNGQPFTSEAVRWTIMRLAKGQPLHTFLTADSVHIIDDLTVDITPSRPNPRLLEQLVHPNYSIIAPGTDPATELVGTGPFKLVKYRRGEWIKLERNDRYWGTAPPLRFITFRFLPDPTTRALSLQAGEVDLIFDVPHEHLMTLRGQAGINVAVSTVGQVAALHLNVHGQPPHDILADKSIRQAIDLALDRRMLVEKIWDGTGEIVRSISPPPVLGQYIAMLKDPKYDPARASKLLDSNGWTLGADNVRTKNGRRLSLTMIAWPEFDSATLEFIHGELASIGIEVQIVKTIDHASYVSRVEAGAFDLELAATAQNDANPIFLPMTRFYSKAPDGAVRYFAPGRTLDEIIEASLQTTDEEEVRRRAAEAMRVLSDEEAIAIPVAGIKRIYAMRNDVQGFSPHPSQVNQRWDTISVRP
jgi:peptide/nickel transport system substrate-binding protein